MWKYHLIFFFCNFIIDFFFCFGGALRKELLYERNSREQAWKKVLSSFFDFFSLSNAKRLSIKAFFKVTLVSLTDRSIICWQFQKRVLSSFFNSLSLSNGKRLTIKAFLLVNLISLTLSAGNVFQIFWKNKGNFAVLVCCTASN